MIPKLIGVLLLGFAGASVFRKQIKKQKQEIHLIEDMAAAIEEMESAIRFRKLPMPALLEKEMGRPYCGKVFSNILQYLQIGIPLQTSWENSMEEIHQEDLRQAISALELSGDEQRVTANLQMCAKNLRTILHRRLLQKGQQQKMTLALTVSGFGLLVILLL